MVSSYDAPSGGDIFSSGYHSEDASFGNDFAEQNDRRPVYRQQQQYQDDLQAGYGQDGAGGGDPNLAMLQKSVPGTPGEDYPIYAEVPSTGFSCEGRIEGGYYADPEAGCQVFHICVASGRGGLLSTTSFLCPNGTVFNQNYFICDYWFNFDCAEAEGLHLLNDELAAEREAASTANQQALYGHQVQGQSQYGQGRREQQRYQSAASTPQTSYTRVVENSFQSSQPSGGYSAPGDGAVTSGYSGPGASASASYSFSSPKGSENGGSNNGYNGNRQSGRISNPGRGRARPSFDGYSSPSPSGGRTRSKGGRRRQHGRNGGDRSRRPLNDHGGAPSQSASVGYAAPSDNSNNGASGGYKAPVSSTRASQGQSNVAAAPTNYGAGAVAQRPSSGYGAADDEISSGYESPAPVGDGYGPPGEGQSRPLPDYGSGYDDVDSFYPDHAALPPVYRDPGRSVAAGSSSYAG